MQYVHTTSDGRIWWGDDYRECLVRAECAHEPASWLSDDPVYVLGDRCNARLLVSLYRTCNVRGQFLHVGTPAECTRHMLQRDPVACMRAMRAMHGVAGSVGGFHSVTVDDYLIYAMWEAGADRQSLARQHTVWPHLMFIDPLATADMANLLANVIDPRWYVNPGRPDNMARLVAWLGLDPYTQRGVLGAGARGRHHDRCKHVQDIWWPRQLGGIDAEALARQTSRPCAAVLSLPGAFIYREWLTRCLQRSVVIGTVRASQLLIRYLWFGWMATMPGSHPEVMFCPEYFFTTDADVDAYVKHMTCVVT